MIEILAIEITAIGNPAIGNRVYTDETRLRGLKAFLVALCWHIVCVDANSIRPVIAKRKMLL